MNTNRTAPLSSRRQVLRAGTLSASPGFSGAQAGGAGTRGRPNPHHRRCRRRRSGGDGPIRAADRDQVNLVSIGNAPSAVVNQLLAGGGQTTFDVINIVGGMQKPLVDNDLIHELDTARLPNWQKDTYIEQYLAPRTPGFQFIGYEERIFGVPTVLQGDSFAYLPQETGTLDSYAALYDPKHKGFVALEDNYTTAGQKTALFSSTPGKPRSMIRPTSPRKRSRP